MIPSPQAELHVFLIVGEESGDRLGAPLMRALRTQTGGKVRFSGTGGAQMASEGLKSLVPLSEFAIMGFTSIPARIIGIYRRIHEIVQAIVAGRPDALVIIDSPDLTHRIARRVRRAVPQIPIVDYVSPSVWAWRPGRARAMRGYVDHVVALLPFEPEVHARLGGPPCSYVGHPLSERVAALRPDAQEEARRNAMPPLVLVMPGSRQGELDHMLGMFFAAAERLAQRGGPIEFVVPTVASLERRVSAAAANVPLNIRIVTETAEKDVAFRRARAAIVKSGTGTLELALAGIPMVAAYRVAAFEALLLRRLISGRSVILANLVLGENVVPELLQEAATADGIADAMLPLLTETPQRARQVDAFRRLDAIMEIGTASPSDRAAAIVLDLARKSPAR